QGWVYAIVAGTGSNFNGLYLTKDFGQNWTQVTIPIVYGTAPTFEPQIPTNDNLRPTVDIFSGGPRSKTAPGNYHQRLAIDPLNPNVVYIGGTADAFPAGFALIRVDTTGLFDPHALVPVDNFANDGGKLAGSNVGAVTPSGSFVSDNPDTNGKHFFNLLK